MGGKEELTSPTPQQILDYLDELCAHALALGMTYDQYWHDDPQIINAYIKAQQIKDSKRNQELWLQGLYIYNALGCVAPMFNALAKDHKPKKYLARPFALSKEEKDEQEYNDFKSKFMALAKQKKEE